MAIGQRCATVQHCRDPARFRRGRESITNSTTNLPPTTNQFHGFIGFSAVTVQHGTSLNTNESFSANAVSLGWPVAFSNGTPSSGVAAILRSAQVGAPYFAQQVSFFFGAVIPPPSTDENGVALPTNVLNIDYWVGQPYTTNTTNLGYYYSPNSLAVYATQAGGVDITWQKATPTNSMPADYHGTNYLVIAGLYYRLYPVHYLVSAAPVQTPQKMYWTEGSFAQTGHPVTVPQASVEAVNIIYNDTFPQYVTPGDLVPVIAVTNTFWFDSTSPLEFHADNVEGQVFLELLGELNSDGVTRRFLGFRSGAGVQAAHPDRYYGLLGRPRARVP